MVMDYNEDKKKCGRQEAVWIRFFYAVRGIFYGYQTERNLRFHVFAAVLVVFFAVFFQISRMEWLFLIFAIGTVISLELINSAVERVVDLVTEEYHELAKVAKDLAAGAVMVSAIASAIIGICIFTPYIVKWISI